MMFARRPHLCIAAGMSTMMSCAWSDNFGAEGTEQVVQEVKPKPPRPAFVQSPILRKFVTTLPGLGPAGANNIGQFIPLATKETREFAGLQTDTYELEVSPFKEKMHPDLPGKTEFFGYSDDRKDAVKQYLGGVIIATRNTPVLLTVRNALPDRSLVPVDPTIDAGPGGLTVGDLPLNRIATHLHGGINPWFSDGTPFQWFTPHNEHGPSFFNVPGTSPKHDSATYYYPNTLGARFVWFHDHAIGLTRTNAYSGIASGFLVTDDFEAALIADGTLPGLGTPLIIQDKGFLPSGFNQSTWKWGKAGDLFYPSTYTTTQVPDFSAFPDTSGTGRYLYGQNDTPPAPVSTPLPRDSVVPEAFLDTPMVNGAIYPVANVPNKRVRYRILNASNARFWHLNLFEESATRPGEPDLSKKGPPLIQIGTDGGFLPTPVIHPNGIEILPASSYLDGEVDPKGPFNLLLAPGERADVIVDFAGWEGKKLILYNDAPAPFPGGDPRNDYFTDDLDLEAFGGAPTTQMGYGPNTRTLMRISVSADTPDTIPTSTVLARLTTALANAYVNGEQPPLLYSGGVPYTGPVHRRLTLNEDFDHAGRLIQRIGTDQNPGTTSDLLTIDGRNTQGLTTFGRSYLDPATETPQRDAVEVWQIFNRTADVHPMHFHLVNVQIIQRESFDPDTMQIVPGTARPPDADESGWKETVRANPGEVLTVITKFTLPTLPPFMGDPVSPRTGGHEYVWHCHILEHEEHDMMRPLIVQ